MAIEHSRWMPSGFGRFPLLFGKSADASQWPVLRRAWRSPSPAPVPIGQAVQDRAPRGVRDGAENPGQVVDGTYEPTELRPCLSPEDAATR